MFVYKKCTFMFRRMLLLKSFPILLILCMKSVESLTNDFISFTCSFKWWSVYFKISVVWQLIWLNTGLPGFHSLWILEVSRIVVLNKSFTIFWSKGVMILVPWFFIHLNLINLDFLILLIFCRLVMIYLLIGFSDIIINVKNFLYMLLS